VSVFKRRTINDKFISRNQENKRKSQIFKKFSNGVEQFEFEEVLKLTRTIIF
jgi:uncharacterized coiled-coil DUF342 family protein